MPVSTETIAVTIAQPADGPSFGSRPRQVDVQVGLLVEVRRDAEVAAAMRTTTAQRRSTRSSLAELARGVVLPLPGSVTARS